MSSSDLIHHHERLDHSQGERRSLIVLLITLFFMVVEIIAGWLTGSMALLGDGWHMGTHAAAIGITLWTYRYARRRRDDPRFTFGTGKVTVLGGYTSAVVLLIVALAIGWESVSRLVNPIPILFDQALLVAVIGLVVNLTCAVILHGGETHDHGHHHHHHHGEGHEVHHDHNLRSAYFHVLADALTSVLAIIALLVGRQWGLGALDPLMGVVGGLVITKWAWGLIATTAPRLLDRAEDEATLEAARGRLAELEGLSLEDCHLWPYGAHGQAMSLRVISAGHRPEEIHAALTGLGIDHLTVEVIAPTVS